MNRSTTNRRKVLVPLATLLAAGGIAVGSGATFTSSSSNVGSSYATGSLTQSNSNEDAAIFSGADLKPGDVETGTVTITNTGSLPATFKLTESAVVNGFDENLTMTVADADGTVFSGEFGELGTEDLGTGAWAAGEARTYTFTVTLAETAGNDYQGETAGATFTWNSTQATS